MRSRKRIASILVGLSLLACGGPDKSFVTTPVVRGAIESTVGATGTVNPVHMVEVGTYASGRVERIEVDYNSRVSEGQLVAKIDPANAQVRVQKARASLLSARARVHGAEADLRLKTEQLERQRALHAQTTVSQDQFELAETAHSQAVAQLEIERARLEESRAELEDANVNLKHTDIRSPVDGIVLSRNVNVGQTVAASFQTPTLFLIAKDLINMQVNTDVSEADIGQVAEGQGVRFSVDAFPDRIFDGRVRQVRNAPISVQNVVTYDVVIDVDNTDLSLRPGMTATVTFITGEKGNVLKIPRRALRFRPEGTDSLPSNGLVGRIWVKGNDGAPEPVEVEVGLRDDEFVEVDNTLLNEGDAVIIGYRREI